MAINEPNGIRAHAAVSNPAELFTFISQHAGIGHPVACDDIGEWLLSDRRNPRAGGERFDQLCWRLVGQDVPLWRATFSTPTLHPQYQGYAYRWWRDRALVEEFRVLHGIRETADYLVSPIRAVIEQGVTVHYSLEGDKDRAAIAAFPMLGRLRSEGATGYFACPLTLFNNNNQAITWATDRPGGFSDANIDVLVKLLPVLGAVADAAFMRRVASGVLDTYLGRTIGRRVLDGQIHRGHGDRLQAILMATDLRGFTGLSDRLPGEELISLLDDYFEAVSQPIFARGGEILKFIGDGVLAIFDVSRRDAGEATEAALAAAEEGLLRLADLSQSRAAKGQSALHMGVGLHMGEVFYGNVGAADRLDFTAIGPAVNLTSRLEGLTKRLDRPLLISEDFARACQRPLLSLGFHPVRGLSRPAEIFGLPEP
ncbi:MAG TPA: adenylate/guanylate cyclase domain-containing protein [Stellaceae bacterium]|nr:adenylate/guanylate cyclase domain-containing protein [Stellaceae bacterium]